MNYSELSSITVLAADFPAAGRTVKGEKPIPSGEELRSLAERAAAAGNGEVVKTLGDSLIVKFSDPLDAVKGALALAETAGGLASPAGDSPRLRPRIGIHVDQARVLDGEILGKAVDGASLLKALAIPGTILVSGEIAAALDPKLFSKSPLAAASQRSLPEGLNGYLIGARDQARVTQASAPKADGSALKGSAGLLEEIRRAIIEDTKAAGRRLSVAEAKEKYCWYGVEAMEVIASLAEAGILVNKHVKKEYSRPEASSQDPRSSYSGIQSGDIGKSIEQAVHSIVSEIERSVRSSAEHRSFDFDGSDWRHAVKRERKNWKEDRKSERRVRRKGIPVAAEASDFEKYRAELETKARKLKGGIIPSILSFGIVNAGLWYLYASQAHSFPWAPIVTIFWGSGVLDSILGAIRAGRHSAETEALTNLDAQTTGELKLLNKERDSVGKHFINALSIPAALFFLNPILWPGKTWPFIVSAILAGFISTMPAKLKKFLAKAGLPADRKSQAEARKRRDSEPKDLGSYADVYEEAKTATAAIASSLGLADPESLAEMKPQLDAFLDQVLLLSKTANELDVIIGEIPMGALASDKAELLAKARQASPALKSEYSGSVAEIEKQEESFKALKEQREIIDLRLRSSVNQLNQLKIDLARARASDQESAASSGESAISSLRARSQELSKYIEDLRNGQLEAIVDPFAELERQFGAQDAEKPPLPPAT
ncbi:MAG: hypothetical protein NT061_09890 [Spirochaetes bacterium]|nr:hypothetical protein [Spirochaetota bacterium]